MPERFFLAGVIQGSQRGKALYPQDYRERVKKALKRRFPKAEIFCPYELPPIPLIMTQSRGRRPFWGR